MFSFREFTKSVARKYNSRPIAPGDPGLTELTETLEGPFLVDRSWILCDKCGTMLRSGYFNMHRSSGACDRSATKRNWRS